MGNKKRQYGSNKKKLKYHLAKAREAKRRKRLEKDESCSSILNPKNEVIFENDQDFTMENNTQNQDQFQDFANTTHEFRKTQVKTNNGTEDRKRDVKPCVQHKSLIVYQDDLNENEKQDTLATRSLQEPVPSTSAGSASEMLHDTFQCDSCRDAVSGIRQVCVQCEYTHCMSCEARGEHGHHYMLRVPGLQPEIVVQKIMKIIQMELVNIKSEANEPEMINAVPHPLKEESPSAEQLTQSMLEQSMLDIVVKEEFHYDDEVVDPPDESVPLQAAFSASGDCNTNLPTNCLVPTPDVSGSNKTESSAAPQASAGKKKFITIDAGPCGPVSIKVESLEEILQTHQEASDFLESGATSNQTETLTERGETGREMEGTTAKKKVEQ